ncbi:hypothetical protein [Shewanella halifaxensis]|uniref:hypothetical protein n=1 Tax=Shewanella halifaxensis TaxID=271098 RepID=UPI00059C65B0|nr:hypothetical protein [Shewanella halifaxensis]
MINIHIYLAIRLIRTGKSSTLYELHCRFRLTYTQALQAVKYLEDIGLVNFDGKTFCLKQGITRYQLKELYLKIRYRNLKLDNRALDAYRKNALSPDSLYFPKLFLLDSTLVVDD